MTRKRKLVRYRCHGAVELSAGNDNKMWGRLGDICRAGFYVSTVGPWPIATELEFRLQVNDRMVLGKGVVASRNPGVGMTVIFRELAPEYEVIMDNLIEQLSETESSPITVNWRV